MGAASGAAAATHRRAPVKHKVHGLPRPSLIAPGNHAHVEQVPTLTWGAVRGAIEYEYQIAADPHFNSIALGSGRGKGASTTHNLAATLGESVPDGAYYWRVRGMSATRKPGAWSTARTLIKGWTAAPQLRGPANGAAIAWPNVPLVMSWTPVPSATEYIVTIATDPGLSNIVLGSATSPQKTDATVFAFPSTLPVGQYYWAITPVDAVGHRGTRSAVATFGWSWPTSTGTQLGDLNPSPQVFDPLFNWGYIPGAAKYEVEVNSASEFPVGSKVCCEDRPIGTSLSPAKNLGNNEYYWRVRAVDAKGNAGVWNLGVGFPGAESAFGFVKAFDSVTPTIPNLAMSDPNGSTLPAGTTTDTPIVTWSPVPGAASYEIQITPYAGGKGCNWGAEEPKFRQTFETATTAWTPIGPDNKTLSHSAWPHPRTDTWPIAQGGTSWCLRVAARSARDATSNQVVSEWTQLGGENHPAFNFENQPAPGEPKPGPHELETEASDYLPPHAWSSATHAIAPCGVSAACQSTPFFTWKRVLGASLYYIVIARDAKFTNVVDVASTIVPAYAPPLGDDEPLDDETTTYYWAIVPVLANGEWFHDNPPNEDAPQGFNKSSTPPTPFGPLGGTTVTNQPTFSWSPAEGALNYTLQVSQDPTFGNLIDNVTTDSTAYTSSSTYPANVTLYWRVRANDENVHNEGLNWSPVATFTRTLPIPDPVPGNPAVGQAIPVLSWTPKEGAVAYDVHVDEANGGTKDFTVNSAAFTPTEWFGTGIWRWKVRAEFPSGSYQQVPGGYFTPQAFVRTLAPPTGALGTKAGSRIVISWNTDPYAKEYKAEVSTTESFSSTIDSDRVDGLSWAPSVDLTQTSNRGTLYWRVAAVDQGSNVGPYATGRFVPPKRKCVVKKVKRKKKTVKVCVAVKHKAAKKK
jgi:hypothetical protein